MSFEYENSHSQMDRAFDDRCPIMEPPRVGSQECCPCEKQPDFLPTKISAIQTPIMAILFDLDGTLLDTESLSDKAMYAALHSVLPDDVKQYAANHHDRLPWACKKQILGLRGSEWAPLVINYAIQHWQCVPADLPSALKLWQDWEDHLNHYCEQVETCSGANEVVQRFAAMGIPMAIATSSRAAAVKRKRKHHEDMFQHFATIVTGDDDTIRQGKPAPDIYLEAARRLNVEPKNCLVVEDALSGVRAGKAAGCRVVAVPDPRFDDAERDVFLKEADLVLPDLTHFPFEAFDLQHPNKELI